MSELSDDTAAHLPGIYDLLRTSFPAETKYSMEYLTWLYIDNPAGKTLSTNLVSENQVMATYAVLPLQFFHHGEPISAALSLNTATHPSERRRGWFTKLANSTYDSAASAGIKVILGVANGNSIRGFQNHLGFDTIGRISLKVATPHQHYVNMDRALGGKSRSRDYWRWRLANPGISYSKVQRDFGTLLVATRKIPVVIGKLDHDEPDIPLNPLLRFSPLAPAFIHSISDYGLDVPRKLLPSPWYFILKNIGLPVSDYESLKKTCSFHGVDSDTF